jgi:hypothetical protein
MFENFRMKSLIDRILQSIDQIRKQVSNIFA